MKKIIKILKNNVFGIVIGIILCAVTIVLAESIASSSVSYDTTISGKSTYNTVQKALDDLYNGLYNIASASGSGLSLVTHTPRGLSSELIAGLYRYQGTQASNVENYICFGTKDVSTCTGNKATYLYRIIGIDAYGRMKLIKWASIGNTAWSTSTGVDWYNSSLYAGLNDNLFYNNTTYVPTDDNGTNWQSKIVKTDWHYITTTSVNMSASAMADLELEVGVEEVNQHVVNNYIGLMYIHDYAYTLATPAYSQTSWIHLSNNGASSSYEWFISRYDTRIAWTVYSNGYLNYYAITSAYSVRPVFYLSSSEVIALGEGTIDVPYTLA